MYTCNTGSLIIGTGQQQQPQQNLSCSSSRFAATDCLCLGCLGKENLQKLKVFENCSRIQKCVSLKRITDNSRVLLKNPKVVVVTRFCKVLCHCNAGLLTSKKFAINFHITE